jgi:hypothetical protein
MQANDEGDWLAQCLDALRPGWRGRLRLRLGDGSDGGRIEEVTGTIVGEPSLEGATDAVDDVVDATATLCCNYRDGHFTPVAGAPCIEITASQILDLQPM